MLPLSKIEEAGMVMDAILHEKLKTVFSDNGYVIYDEAVEDQLEIDSLQFLSIMCDIESQFDIEIPDEKVMISQLGTLDQIINVVRDGLKLKEH